MLDWSVAIDGYLLTLLLIRSDIALAEKPFIVGQEGLDLPMVSLEGLRCITVSWPR